MSREEIEVRKEQMRLWYWWGVPTFFKYPWNESPEDCHTFGGDDAITGTIIADYLRDPN